jgi:serine/threonine protein kinase
MKFITEGRGNPNTTGSSPETFTIELDQQEKDEKFTKIKEKSFYDKRYKVIERIGNSNGNKILLAYDYENFENVIIKASILSNFTLLTMENEAKFLGRVNHPNIISFKGWIKNGKKSKNINSKTCRYIVMEYAKKGELFYYIKLNQGLFHKIAKIYFRQLILAVEYLHKENICHRDIKVDNILLDENFNLKLADFEFCSYIKDDKGDLLLLTDKLGSLSYMAPEFFNHRIHPILNGFKIFHTGDKVDIFSCGVVLFIMLTGFFPFSTAEKTDLYFSYFFENKPEMFWDKKRIKKACIPQCAKELINRMFEPDPDKRITIEEIKKHEFFSSSDIPSDSEMYSYMNSIWLMISKKELNMNLNI